MSLAITLPILVLAVGALVATTLLAVREHRRARALADELSAARTEATLLERRDDDTGLWNSRFFVEALTREIERSRTYDRPGGAGARKRRRHRRRRGRGVDAHAGRGHRRQRPRARRGLPGGHDRVRRDHARDRLAGRPRSHPSACCARSPAPAPRAARRRRPRSASPPARPTPSRSRSWSSGPGAALRSARRAVRDGAGQARHGAGRDGRLGRRGLANRGQTPFGGSGNLTPCRM